LSGGRVDAVVCAIEVFGHMAKWLGGNVDDFESVYTFKKGKWDTRFMDKRILKF
jgi:hypothetical protein